MKELVILGAGKIGRMVYHLMATTGDYDVRIGDAFAPAIETMQAKYPKLNGKVVEFDDEGSLDAILQGFDRPTKAQVEHAKRGHVIAEATLIGTYMR